MVFSNAPLLPPDEGDFERIGLRFTEFRPLVIRRAVTRSAQPLALMHLRSPDAEVEQLWVGMTLSAYRVLDPRRRGDVQSRSMLGRIHALLAEEPSEAAPPRLWGEPAAAPPAGLDAVMSPEAAFMNELERAARCSGIGPAEVHVAASERFFQPGDSAQWDSTLRSDDLLIQRAPSRVFRAIRRQAAGLSVASKAAITMLAASILMVATWRTTAWIRSARDSRLVVEVSGPAVDDQVLPTQRLPGDPEVPEGEPAAVPSPPATSRDAEAPDAEANRDLPDLSPADDPNTDDTAAGRERESADADVMMEPIVPEPVPAIPEADESRVAESPAESDAESSRTESPEESAAMPGARSDSEDGFLRDPFAEPATLAESDAESLRIDAEVAEDVPASEERTSIPSDAEFASARLRIEQQLRELQPAGRRMTQLKSLADRADPGSADRWVALLAAGREAIFNDAADEVEPILDELSEQFAISRETAARRLARQAGDDAASEPQRNRLGDWIDGQLRKLFRSGELEAAGELALVLLDLGNRYRDDAMRGKGRAWRDSLAVAQRYRDDAQRIRESGDMQQATPTQRASAGRYWALVRRDWPRALPLLAAGNNAKLAHLAGIELLSGSRPDPRDAETLADGYVAEAKRIKGHLADAYLVHAHELLLAAAEGAGEAKAIELKRTAERLRNEHADAFREIPGRGIAEPRRSRTARRDSADSGREVAAASSEAPSDEELVGRLQLDGEDVGILLRYPAGLRLSRAAVERMAEQVNFAEGQLGELKFDFVGVLHVTPRSTEAAFVLTPPLPGDEEGADESGHELLIDGRRLSEVGRLDDGRWRVSLDRGTYLLRWKVSLTSQQAFAIRVLDAATGEPLRITAPPITMPNHPAAMPTRWRVRLAAES